MFCLDERAPRGRSADVVIHMEQNQHRVFLGNKSVLITSSMEAFVDTLQMFSLVSDIRDTKGEGEGGRVNVEEVYSYLQARVALE